MLIIVLKMTDYLILQSADIHCPNESDPASNKFSS